MALAQEDIDYIKTQLGAWLAEQSLAKPPLVYEIELRERMVRVEEELKHQRELMLLLQQQMRESFERVDKRFEEVDKRFEAMQTSMDKRFEQMDKRFEQMDKRFDEMLKRHDQYFLWLVAFIATGVGLVVAALRYM